MSMFGNLSDAGTEKVEDRLGGYSVKETDIYLATVKMAYGIKSNKGALGVVFIFDIGGQEYTETIYVTNKDGNNTYPDKQDPTKKHLMPGYITVNDICLLTTEKNLPEVETEEKVVKIYNYDERKELPQAVNAFTDMIGKKVYLAIVKQTVNKNKRNESTGEYEPTDETRDENTIEKAFHEELKVTIVEAKNNNEPTYFGAWLEKNKGKTRDKTTKDAAKSGKPGGGAPQANGAQQERKTGSLFGGNK